MVQVISCKLPGGLRPALCHRGVAQIGSHVRRIENAVEGRVEQIVTHEKERRMLYGFRYVIIERRGEEAPLVAHLRPLPSDVPYPQ